MITDKYTLALDSAQLEMRQFDANCIESFDRDLQVKDIR